MLSELSFLMEIIICRCSKLQDGRINSIRSAAGKLAGDVALHTVRSICDCFTVAVVNRTGYQLAAVRHCHAADGYIVISGYVNLEFLQTDFLCKIGLQ